MLSYEDTAAFCRSLATLNHAGVGSADSLYLMADDAPDEKQKAMLKEMASDADFGMAQSEAVRKTGAFPEFVPSMMAVGERTGHVEETMESLADYYEGRMRLDGQLKSALLYPSILLLVMLAVLVVLLAYVLPVFSEVYARLGTGFSGFAGGLLSLGGVLSKLMPVLCVVLGLLVAFLLVFALSERFRTAFIRKLGVMTGEKGISRATASATFMQALSLGVNSGMATDEAVALASTLMDTPGSQKRAKEAEGLLLDGSTLADALKQTEFVTASEARILSAAFRSGAGDRALQHASETATEQSEEAVQKLLGRVEPAMVLTGAILVGLILLSVMLPLLHIMSAIG